MIKKIFSLLLAFSLIVNLIYISGNIVVSASVESSNLVADPGFEKDFVNFSVGGMKNAWAIRNPGYNAASVTANDIYDGSKALHINRADGGNGMGVCTEIELEAGVNYALSFYHKGIKNMHVAISLNWNEYYNNKNYIVSVLTADDYIYTKYYKIFSVETTGIYTLYVNNDAIYNNNLLDNVCVEEVYEECDELLADGNFEKGTFVNISNDANNRLNGWANSYSTTGESRGPSHYYFVDGTHVNVRTGKGALKLQPNYSSGHWNAANTYLNVKAGETYNYSFWAKSDAAGTTFQINISSLPQVYNSFNYTNTITVNSASWTKFTGSFIAPESQNNIIWLGLGNASASVYIDDMSIVSVEQSKNLSSVNLSQGSASRDMSAYLDNSIYQPGSKIKVNFDLLDSYLLPYGSVYYIEDGKNEIVMLESYDGNFKFTMPENSVKLYARAFTVNEENGVTSFGTSIKEADNDKPTSAAEYSGIQFGSIAYKNINVDSVNYTLKDRGTILIKANGLDESKGVTKEMWFNALNENPTAPSSSASLNGINGIRQTSTTYQYECDDYIQYAIRLYGITENNMQEYSFTSFGYAVYSAEGEKDIIKFSEKIVSNNYNGSAITTASRGKKIKYTINSEDNGYEDYIDSLYYSVGSVSPEKSVSGVTVVKNKIIDDIVNSKSTIRSTGGTTYYVSESGSDDWLLNGKSSNNPISLKALKDMQTSKNGGLDSGDVVLFKRGDVFRAGARVTYMYETVKGVSYGAYGEGAKPIFNGSLKNYADPSLWTYVGGTADGNRILYTPIGSNFSWVRFFVFVEEGKEYQLSWKWAAGTTNNQKNTIKSVYLYTENFVKNQDGSCSFDWVNSSDKHEIVHTAEGFGMQTYTRTFTAEQSGYICVGFSGIDTVSSSYFDDVSIIETSESEVIINEGFDNFTDNYTHAYKVSNDIIWHFVGNNFHTVDNGKTLNNRNIWELNESIRNAGVIVLDYSGKLGNTTEKVGTKRIAGINGFATYSDLSEDCEYYNDVVNSKLYLYSETNPGERFSSIEISDASHAIIMDNGATVIENLAFLFGKYGVITLGDIKNPGSMNIKNCIFGYFGGSNLSTDPESDSYTQVCGNAIEAYGSCDGFYVENCWIYQCCDTGITHQNWRNDLHATQNDIVIKGNVIEKCTWGIEFGNIDASEAGFTNTTTNFIHSYNVIVDTGYGFGTTNVDRNTYHMGAYYSFGTTNMSNGVAEKNILFRSQEWLFRTQGADSQIELKNNLCIQDEGVPLGYIEHNYVYYNENGINFFESMTNNTGSRYIMLENP